MRRMYEDGHMLKDIARELGRNESSVRQYLIDAGLHAPKRRQAMTDKDRRAIVEMYSQGASIAAIREKTGYAYNTIYKCIDAQGVPRRKPKVAGSKARRPAKRIKWPDPLPPHEIAPADVRRLAINILKVAAEDACDRQHRDDALEFFGSRWYRHILTALDLPPTLLPKGVRLEAA
jgi:transposase-like protein